MMLKQSLINKIISSNMAFEMEKNEDSQDNETWIEVETLQEYNDKIDAYFKEMLGDLVE